MFFKLKEAVGNSDYPKINISDFEKAVFKSIDKVFPSEEHKGYRFQLNAALSMAKTWYGLQGMYHQDNTFHELFHKQFPKGRCGTVLL